MKVLVLNSGSSSLKYALYEAKQPRFEALVEHIGERESMMKDHAQAIALAIRTLQEAGYVNDINDLDGVGHRVVHGGHYFSNSVIIDTDVINKIEECSALAPLHNPANLEGMRVIKEMAPHLKQVAVFDTAFHQSMPQQAYLYALPYTLYEQEHIRRYGFHGTSHAHVMKTTAAYLKREIEGFNALSLHLGNGASICAIKAGESVDTSMGFSPLEGLIMGTRSGDIDAEIVLYLQERLDMDFDAVRTLLNKKSGLLGIANENDMRQILIKKDAGDVMAQLAFEMFVYRIRKYLGAYAFVLGRVDAIIFTGGIGENSAVIRSAIMLEVNELLGWEIDTDKNINSDAKVNCISSDSSRTCICVVKTDESLEIVSECHTLLA